MWSDNESIGTSILRSIFGRYQNLLFHLDNGPIEIFTNGMWQGPWENGLKVYFDQGQSHTNPMARVQPSHILRGLRKEEDSTNVMDPNYGWAPNGITPWGVRSDWVCGRSCGTQRALLIIERCCDKVGLSVSPNKTELIVFTNRRKLSDFHFKASILFGAKLQMTKSVKYHGIT